MRITYLHYLVDGDTALHHVEQFTGAARRLGHNVDVCPMNFHRAEPGVKEGTGLSQRVGSLLKRRLSRYLHEPKELLWNLPYTWAEMRLLRRLRPDVLLVRHHTLTASCVPVARVLGLPLVLELNAPAAESREYFSQYAHLPWVADWLEGYKVRAVDGVTVVSSSLADYIVARHAVARDRILVNPNGADPEKFHSDTPADPQVALLSRGGPVVGFVGSFHPWHGAPLLCKVVRLVAALRPRVAFVLAGDGLEAEEARRLASELPHQVLWLGRVPYERIPSLVAAFDVGLMPESNVYGSPLKVLEWMCAGRAVVAPRYRPLEDVIESGVHGLLFPPGDERALIQALLQVIDNGDLRARLGSAAAARVRLSFTWLENAHRVLDLCAKVLNRQRSEKGVERACGERGEKELAGQEPGSLAP